MAKENDRNQNRIIRQDGKNCFVESKNDCFEIGKAHLEFVQYDTSRPEGQRYVGHVHIYLDMGEFMLLAHDILNNGMHIRMQQQKDAMKAGKKDLPVLFESLGGTSAKTLASRNQSRSDGMSLSRCIRLFTGMKKDYLLTAQSGAGQEDAKGLIVPRYGTSPEEKVSIAMSWQELNKLMLMTKIHYEAWLAEYYRNYTQNRSK